VIFLTISDICEINREWIERYGGRYVALDNNLCNRSSLEYVLSAIQYPIFGIERYPSLVEKAAALAWWIIEGHVFNDGNKRTGMQAAIEFVEINDGVHLFTYEAIISIALGIATRDIGLGDLTALFVQSIWFPNFGLDY